MIIATALFAFIEKPVRTKLKFTFVSPLQSFAILNTIVISAMLLVTSINFGSPAISTLIATKNDLKWYVQNDPCLDFGSASLPLDACGFGQGAADGIVLIGDSHAGYVAREFFRQALAMNKPIAQFASSHCMPVPGVASPATTNNCPEIMGRIFSWLTDISKTHTVILVSRWPLGFEGTRFDNLEGGLEPGGTTKAYTPQNLHASEQERRRNVAAAIKSGIDKYLELGFNVVLVYPVPEMGWDVPEHIAGKLDSDPEYLNDPLAGSTSYKLYLERTAGVRAALDAAGPHPSLFRVYPDNVFCEKNGVKRCFAHLKGKLLYSDDDHLSDFGAELIFDQIKKIITLN